MTVELNKVYDLYIDGKWMPVFDRGTFEVRNPATGRHLADCAGATKEDMTPR